MKTNFFLKSLLAVILSLGVCVCAQAQLKGVLNKAKKAVKEKTEKAVENAVDNALGNDSQQTTSTSNSSQKSTSTSRVPSQKEQVKSYGSGPEIPRIMAMETSYSDYDESGKYLNSVAWGLRKTSQSEAKTLAEKLTARFKWVRKTLQEMQQGENYELEMQLKKEFGNWQAFYVKIGEIMNLINNGDYKKDNTGAFYLDRPPLMHVGMHVAGNQASEEGVMGIGSVLFTRNKGKAYFCDYKLDPVFAEEDALRVAKLDLNMATNISILFEGYPVEWCRETQNGVMKDQFAIYYQKALTYASALKEAIKGNSLDNLEFKPVPKAGSMNASLNAQALAAEKKKGKDAIKVVIVSNSWEIQKNALGQPVRRVVYGYSIANTKHGKMATRVSWAEDYQGGGKYGSLNAYGVGTEYFYVK